MNRLIDAVIYGIVVVVVFFAVAAAMGNDSLKAMIAARGARAIVLSRGKLPPAPVPPGPKPGPAPRDPCCNECKGTGKWKPDNNALVECPCDPSCSCKCKSGKCAVKGATK